MTFENILQVFEAHKNGKGYMALCPAHEDRNPSLSLSKGRNGRTLAKCFAGCSVDDILLAKGLRRNDLFPTSIKTGSHTLHRNGRQSQATQQRNRATVAALAAHKKLPGRYLLELGLRDGGNGVEIPLVNLEGNEVGVRTRSYVETAHPTYWDKSETRCAYHRGGSTFERARKLREIVFVEGESDCWTLWFHDIPAVGIPGASMTKLILAEYVEGVDRVYLVREPTDSNQNDAGAMFVRGAGSQLRTVGYPGEILVLDLKATHNVKDPSDLHMALYEKHGTTREVVTAFQDAWQTAMDAARSPRVTPRAAAVDNDSTDPWRVDVVGISSDFGNAPTFNAVRWSDVKMRRIKWLIRDRIPFGELTIADGPGGVGKTTVVLDIIARATRGRSMPDGTPCMPLNALIIAEEDRDEIIKARLLAAGADLERVTLLASVGDDRHFFSLPSDSPSLFAAVEKYDASIVTIDALFSHLDRDIKSYNPQDARRAITPLSKIAHEAKSQPAIIPIRHWSKGARSAAERGLGSTDFRNVSRSVLSINKIHEDENRYAIAVSKSNLGRPCEALTYSLENAVIEADGDTLEIARVAWGENADISADELANDALPSPEEQTKTDAACDWLRDKLADGSQLSQDLYDEAAKKSSFSASTLKRASRKLKVISTREGFQGKTTWSLPFSSQSAHSAHHTNSELSEPTGEPIEPSGHFPPPVGYTRLAVGQIGS